MRQARVGDCSRDFQAHVRVVPCALADRDESPALARVVAGESMVEDLDRSIGYPSVPSVFKGVRVDK